MKTTILTAETIATLDENDRLRAERIAKRKAYLRAASKKQKARMKEKRAALRAIPKPTPENAPPEIKMAQSLKWVLE